MGVKSSESLEERKFERVFAERLEESEQASTRVGSEHGELDDRVASARALAHSVSREQTRRVRTRRREQTRRRARLVEAAAAFDCGHLSTAASRTGTGSGTALALGRQRRKTRSREGRIQSQRRGGCGSRAARAVCRGRCETDDVVEGDA